MWRKKHAMSDAESDALMLARRPRGMLIEELSEAMLRTLAEMTPDQKAHLRAKMDRSVGIAPKSSDGKPF